MFEQGSENITIEVSGIRELSKLNPWQSIVALLVEWLIIIVAIAIGEGSNQTWLYPIVWLVIGTRMYALYSLLHDGIHYLLFPKKQINNWLCRFFLAWPLFISLRKIRKFHLAHHQHLKTENDPEAAHLEYREFQFPKTAGELALTFLKDITGINFIVYRTRKICFFVTYLFGKTSRGNPKTSASLLQFEPGMFIYYLVIGSILFYTGNAGKFVLYWIIPYCTVYQLLNRIRLSTEHFHLPEDKLIQTRTVKLNFAEGFIFSPHNLGFHAEHHLYPSVPFYRLPCLHKKLMAIQAFRSNVVISNSYFNVIAEYIK